jgi:hypothetical protein
MGRCNFCGQNNHAAKITPTHLNFCSEFQISELEFQFLNFSTAELKKNLTRIFGIKNGIEIPLPMGASEIGRKNWNSQPSRPRS